MCYHTLCNNANGGKTLMAEKKTVFLTGASGHMGWAGFKELYSKKDKLNIVLLLRDSEKNRKKFANYLNDPSVKIVWGDLKKYDDVLKCVEGSDYVLHVGGMVSPSADYYPTKTIQTNTTAAKNIVDAVKAQPNKDDIKVVYIGTVAQTGDRNAPIHWARTGDPIKISIYDHYAISKTIAESIFAESGLKHWVSLRQSGILYPDILKNIDPIMFHVPINGVLEWATVEDSGRLLANICEPDVPEDFWRQFYNIGSGKEYSKQMMTQVAPYYKLAFLAKPFAGILKKTFMKKLANTEIYGTMWWISNNVEDRITAYYGSKKNWEAIGNWDTFKIERPTAEVTLLDHGYDESKPESELDLEDMKKAAAFRGGECLSTEMTKGDLFTPLKWKCAHGHEFEMTPNLVLKGGHWCPKELPSDSEGKKFHWAYDAEAKVNPFFAQVWYPLHDKDENNEYDERIFKGFSGFENI